MDSENCEPPPPASKLLREPLLHFLVLAGVLFLANALWTTEDREKIVVDRQTAAFLIQQREDLELRELTPEEREQTILSFVEDEILYKEAYKRGLDQGDSRMRRNLILKMRGLLTSDTEEPTEARLREYFESEPQRYTRPPTVSLDHVFFKSLENIPGGMRQKLNDGLDPRGLGEGFGTFGQTLPGYSQRDLVGLFGPDTARTILTITNDVWHGPLESPRGYHFIRIAERRPAQRHLFEDVQKYLESDYMMAQARNRIEAEVERLQNDYEIIIEGPETGEDVK